MGSSRLAHIRQTDKTKTQILAFEKKLLSFNGKGTGARTSKTPTGGTQISGELSKTPAGAPTSQEKKLKPQIFRVFLRLPVAHISGK